MLVHNTSMHVGIDAPFITQGSAAIGHLRRTALDTMLGSTGEWQPPVVVARQAWLSFDTTGRKHSITALRGWIDSVAGVVPSCAHATAPTTNQSALVSWTCGLVRT